MKAARFDLGKVFGEFLLYGEKAERTQSTYRWEVGRFFSYLGREGLHVLHVRRADVNRYKISIREVQRKQGTTGVDLGIGILEVSGGGVLHRQSTVRYD